MRNFIDLVKRAFEKLVLHPVKYGKGGDYQAETYWKDRFSKYGKSLRAVGHEGLTEKENREDYLHASSLVLEILKKEGLDAQKSSLLEIGSGTGYYTRKIAETGLENQYAIDITDHFFSSIKNDVKGVKLFRKDIGSDELEGEYDFILMIDVVQHIVDSGKFRFAMQNISRHLKPSGVLLISGIKGDEGGRQLFYVKSWKKGEVTNALGMTLKEEVPFRRGTKLLVYEKG